MFRGQKLTRPKNQSIILTAIVAVAVLLSSLVSPVAAYFAGVTGLLAIIFALILESFWPTKNKQENSIVFSLFWGVMLGGIVPMVVSIFLESGFEAIYEMLIL